MGSGFWSLTLILGGLLGVLAEVASLARRRDRRPLPVREAERIASEFEQRRESAVTVDGKPLAVLTYEDADGNVNEVAVDTASPDSIRRFLEAVKTGRHEQPSGSR